MVRSQRFLVSLPELSSAQFCENQSRWSSLFCSITSWQLVEYTSLFQISNSIKSIHWHKFRFPFLHLAWMCNHYISVLVILWCAQQSLLTSNMLILLLPQSGVLHAAPCQEAACSIKVHYYILFSRFIVTSLIMIRDDLSFMYYVSVVWFLNFDGPIIMYV